MKILSLILVIVFVFNCSTFAQEKKNPLAGTTWEMISGKWEREDTTFTFPKSPHDERIIIFGKSHYGIAWQDTSRDYSWPVLAKYTVDGDNFTATFKMASYYPYIGSSFTPKYQIEGNKLIVKLTDYHFGGYKWKELHEVWSRRTKTQEKENPLAGTTWELISGKWTREDTTITFPNSPSDKYIGIFGQTCWNIVNQDTSGDVMDGSSFTYSIDGDNFTFIPNIHLIYDTIGKTFSSKFNIEGDQLIFDYKDLQIGDFLWKSGRNIWKRIE